MASTDEPRDDCRKDTNRLYDGDFIDLTSEIEPQTSTVDDDLELVQVETAPKRVENLPKNSTKFLIPLVSSANGSKYLLVDQTIMKSPAGAYSARKNVQQTQPLLTKLNFRNTGGKITVEETVVPQTQNVIIQGNVKIAPSNLVDTTTIQNQEQVPKNATPPKSQLFNNTNLLLVPTTSSTTLKKVTEADVVPPPPQPKAAPLILNASLNLAKPKFSKSPHLKKRIMPTARTSKVIVLSDDEEKVEEEDIVLSQPEVKVATLAPPIGEPFARSLQTRWAEMKLSVNDQPTDDATSSATKGNNNEPRYYVVFGPLEEKASVPLPLAPMEPLPTVTPVDITDILNKAKKPPELQPKDRCECIAPPKPEIYTRGFTRVEMKKPSCLKHLQEALLAEETVIRRWRNSQCKKVTFVPCPSEPSNFLPEAAVKCEQLLDEDEDEEFSIEYNNIEDQLRLESATLPVIKEVIKEVRTEVGQLRERSMKGGAQSVSELRAKLAKPEEALKLIQKGLELIKNWSKETHLEKKGKVPATATATNGKRGKKEEGFLRPVTRSRGRGRGRGRGGRGGKQKLEEYSDSNDLLIVKKVDILPEKRRRGRFTGTCNYC